MVCSQPLNRPGLFRTPWASTVCPRISRTVALHPLPNDAFAGWGSVRLSLALARSRRIALHPRGLLSAVVNRDAISLVDFRRCTPTASYGLFATPVLLGRTVPPGRLRSSTGFPYEPASIRSRRTPLTSVFPDCSGTFSVTGWAYLIVQVRTPDSYRYVRFQPHSSWTIRMSLSTLVISADIAQRRVFGLFATPDMFGPNQSPLSAVHLPQALVSVVTASLPTCPFASSGGVQLSSALAESRRISFFLTDSLAMMRASLPCFRIANAIATWRQALVCLRPLSYYG